MNDQSKIKTLLANLFAAQSAFDGAKMLAAFHEGAMLHLVGNNNTFRVTSAEEQAAHLDQVRARVPDLKVELVLDEIEKISIHEGLIASVHLRYRMLMPGSMGMHRAFYNLACMDGQWGIVNIVDRGFEKVET